MACWIVDGGGGEGGGGARHRAFHDEQVDDEDELGEADGAVDERLSACRLSSSLVNKIKNKEHYFNHIILITYYYQCLEIMGWGG